jgi:hypothetical protein
MKMIACWQDLTPYGIEPLTGEACGLMYRILFDATETGRQVLAKALGIPNLRLAEAWNPGSKEEPHVGSIMLTTEMLAPLAVFALLESGCDEVYGHKDCVVGFDATDSPERRQRYLEHYRDGLGRRYAYAGTAGSRNVHVMSGRID